jgi:leucyl aminopeptidase (aminopeptidase T)
MSYQEKYRDTNEELGERFALVMERIDSIRREQAAGVDVAYRQYFTQMAQLLGTLQQVAQQALAGRLDDLTQEEGGRLHAQVFSDVQAAGYGSSYANPQYAAEKLGKEYGTLLSALDAQLHDLFSHCVEGDLRYLCLYAELFVEIYNCFEDEELLSDGAVSGILYSFMHDYTEVFGADAIERLIDPSFDYGKRLVMESNLDDASYLYRYGQCIGPDEKQIAAFLSACSEDDVQAMARTFTEGYRIGFEVTGKDISKKSVVEIRYPIGFERMVRAAVQGFAEIGLEPVLKPYSISANRQYRFDHKEDAALWLDKAFVERSLEVERSVWEKNKEQAAKYGGPAVIEVFGQEPFAPDQKEARAVYSRKQQELSVYWRSSKSRLVNQYIHGEERSFTIIAYPIPSIGAQFSEIFAETVRINTLDYALYRDMQQKLIDVLDTADRVHIVGRGENRTDLYVQIHPLADPSKETAFENCVADVNIPVGEVFTTPVLAGTEGRLHVTQVYLNGLSYRNLELVFENGMIADCKCTNFSSEEQNRRFLADNLLFHHETLPMGEFAIGTNTTAYSMARRYGIFDKLPILIAEKTGPHFAVGDTCYTYDEDNMTYNPDGKAIVARDNEVSIRRKEDVSRAYFNCHTDITIPYDELGRITVIRKDGTAQDIIADGRFVVPGTEALNEPLEELERSVH